MNQLVLPNDTNTLNNLMGGILLHWMDIAAAISAQKHAGTVCVTAAVDNVSFAMPIKLGHVVTISAKVVRAFNTSLEVHLEVWAQDLIEGSKYKCNEAFYTFVSLNSEGKRIGVPQLKPESDQERELYENSLLRRQMKLLMAGKIKIKDAAEIHDLFRKWLEDHEKHS
jgi:acyl-CoA hydrolase